MRQESLHLSAGPFDDYAATYDSSFSMTALGHCLRKMVWQRFDVAFASSNRILEIGCGTGEDSIYFARRGHDVVATDASAGMLRVAKKKAENEGCAQRIQFRHIPMEKLGHELATQRFDGISSNFGAMNCASRLGSIVSDVAPLLTKNAPLVWVVMGRYVPWEWVWFLARGDWRKAFRRHKKGGAVWKGMRIQYPTPRQLGMFLQPHFEPLGHRSLGFALPPTFAADWLESSPRMLSALTHVERAAQRIQLCATLADHYIMEARRTPAQANA